MRWTLFKSASVRDSIRGDDMSLADEITDAMDRLLISENEHDSAGEPANIVDGLFAIARAIEAVAAAMNGKTEIKLNDKE